MGRRVAGAVWLGAWCAVLAFLWLVWQRLGLWVDDRLLWSAELLLGVGAVGGACAGDIARERAAWGCGRSHASSLRTFLLPPAIVTALLSAAWTAVGGADEARVAFGTFAAYWAGFDVAFGAWPLVRGRPYRFLRELPPEEEASDDGPPRSPSRWF